MFYRFLLLLFLTKLLCKGANAQFRAAELCKDIDMRVSFVTGHVLLPGDDDKGDVKGQRIRKIKVIAPMNNGIPGATYNYCTIGCSRDGAQMPIDNGFSLAEFDSIRYDADGHVITIRTHNCYETGCGSGGYSYHCNQVYTRNIYAADQLVRTIAKFVHDGDKAHRDTDMNMWMTTDYSYNHRGQKTLEAARAGNIPHPEQSGANCGIQYVYDAKGLLRWKIVLRNPDDTLTATALSHAPDENMDRAYMRYQFYELQDSFNIRDFGIPPEEEDEDGTIDRKRNALIKKRDSIDHIVVDSLNTKMRYAAWYQYDKQGMLVKEANFRQYFTPQHIGIDTFMYDIHKRLVCRRTSDIGENLKEWRYGYDKNGRVAWCAQTVYNGNGFFNPVRGTLPMYDLRFDLSYNDDNTVKSFIRTNPVEGKIYHQPFTVEYERY